MIVANVLFWLTEPGLGIVTQENFVALTRFFFRWGLVPSEITTGQPISMPVCAGVCKQTDPYLSLVTSMFLHGGPVHLGGNMLFLWVFGNNIEDTLGKAKFVAFYFATGLAAGLAHVFANPNSVIPTVGASGAVAGVLGAYIVLFPHARVKAIIPTFFIWFVELPAMIVLGLWFVSQFLIAAGQQLGGAGVAWMAHVGGFIAGALLMLALRPRHHERSIDQYPGW